MKRILLLTILSVFVLGNIILFSEYLDVGDDPGRIKIDSIKEISILNKYNISVGEWSPDGEFFIMDILDDEDNFKKSLILKKDGSLFKELDGLQILWLNDSKNIILTTEDEFYIYNIFTDNKVVIEIPENDDLEIHSISQFDNNLVFCIKNKIYKYDFSSKKYTLIYTTPIYSSIINSAYIQKDKTLLFSQFLELNQEYNDCLYLVNMNTNKSKIIKCGNLSDIVLYPIKSGQTIFVYRDQYINFRDKSGNLIYKFQYFLKSYEGDKGDMYKMEYSSLSPNGKLFAITRGIFGTQSYFVESGDIIVMNLKGKKANLTNTQDKIELMCTWSPQGNKMVYYEEKSGKYYLINIKRI